MSLGECPIPLDRYPQVTLAHGGGGRLMQQLIDDLILAAFQDPVLHARTDAAVLPRTAGRLAFTTDTFVVKPLEFPGGDIGRLAVLGTVNDLAMVGARARWLSIGLILEEGLPMERLWRLLCSISEVARASGVSVVTGDTKVIERGRGDGCWINTSGVGELEHERLLEPGRIREGDVILLSGDVGRHGIAVMSAREGLEFDVGIESDCSDLSPAALQLAHSPMDLRCMRDATRGGVAAVLHEWAGASGFGIEVREQDIPIGASVAGACEMLGLDPLQVACEGRFLAVVGAGDEELALSVLRASGVCPDPRSIGRVTKRGRVPVLLRTRLGVTRVLELARGDLLPRIC